MPGCSSVVMSWVHGRTLSIKIRQLMQLLHPSVANFGHWGVALMAMWKKRCGCVPPVWFNMTATAIAFLPGMEGIRLTV